MERTKILPEIDLKLDKMGQELSGLSRHQQVVHNRLLSLEDSVTDQSSKDPLIEITSQGVLSTLTKIETLIKNSTTVNPQKRPNHRHSSKCYNSAHHSNQNQTLIKKIVEETLEKVERIEKHIVQAAIPQVLKD